MSILDLLGRPWAIEPDRLIQLHEIYAARLRGEQDLEAIEAAMGRQLQKPPQGYEVLPGGVAVIPLMGVMAPRMNMLTAVSGGASAELLVRDLKAAKADPAVRAVLVRVDSPGGAVAGTQSAAAALLALRGVKPTATLAEGTMASAAVWFGSAADRTYLSSGVDVAGSVGVVGTHVDTSQQQKAAGVVRTEIVAGSYKRIASENGPLTEPGREYMQSQVDYFYSLFVQDLAMHKGLSTEQVLEQMADGRIFIGQQAVDVGLVDGIASMDAVVAELIARADSATGSLPILSQAPKMSEQITPTTAAELATAFPAAAAALKTEAIAEGYSAGHAAGHSEGLIAGAAAECARIQAVRAQSLSGHEALIEQLANDGRTTGPEAAMAVNAAERQRQATVGSSRLAGVQPAIPQAGAPEGSESETIKAVEPDPVAVGKLAQELIADATAQGRRLEPMAAFLKARESLKTTN
jgi:signal peptide peptidase SppA